MKVLPSDLITSLSPKSDAPSLSADDKKSTLATSRFSGSSASRYSCISNPGKPSVPPDRFIDEYKSRNERLAGLMRRLGVCEEKGSGVDKVIKAVEAYQLPAPDFRGSEQRTHVILFAQKSFQGMDRNDRVRACYQHCCLCYVMNQKMTNQSLRERFGLSKSKSATASKIITATIDAGHIKLDAQTISSTRYNRYIPFWA